MPMNSPRALAKFVLEIIKLPKNICKLSKRMYFLFKIKCQTTLAERLILWNFKGT